jgi:large subunit ribosomal protein L30
MSKVTLRQVRSSIKRPHDQVATLKALGLGKINRTVEKTLSPQVEGMIKKVSHLIEIINS